MTQVVPVIVCDRCITYLGTVTIHVTNKHTCIDDLHFYNISNIVNIAALTSSKNWWKSRRQDIHSNSYFPREAGWASSFPRCRDGGRQSKVRRLGGTRPKGPKLEARKAEPRRGEVLGDGRQLAPCPPTTGQNQFLCVFNPAESI